MICVNLKTALFLLIDSLKLVSLWNVKNQIQDG